MRGRSRPVCFIICKFTSTSLPTQTSFDSLSGKIEFGQSCLNILNIYCGPGPATTFFSEFQDILSHMIVLTRDLVLINICINSS